MWELCSLGELDHTQRGIHSTCLVAQAGCALTACFRYIERHATNQCMHIFFAGRLPYHTVQIENVQQTVCRGNKLPQPVGCDSDL